MKTAVFLIVLTMLFVNEVGYSQSIVRVASNPIPINRVEKPPIFANPNQFITGDGIAFQDAKQEGKQDSIDGVQEIPSLRDGIPYNVMARAVNNKEIASCERSLFNYSSTATLAPTLRDLDCNQAHVKTWNSPNVYHRPLYFEDVNVERYGNHHGTLQPFYSGVRFVTDTLALPYKMGRQHPKSCTYGLGYYRPGNCNPAYISQQPISKPGALLQGMVSLALFYGL